MPEINSSQKRTNDPPAKHPTSPERREPTALRDCIASVLSEHPGRSAVRELVDLCYRFALAYLRRKQAARRLDTGFFGLTDKDLALDAIAELFERDDEGRFVQLVTYYERNAWGEAVEMELLEQTRRLVFSKVNERLYAAYREIDPSLGHLIRSIKVTLKKPEAPGELTRSHTSSWVAFGPLEDDHRPLMPSEILEAYLTGSMREKITTLDMLEAAADVILAQAAYRAGYPLVPLAQALRCASVRVQDAAADGNLQAPFSSSEVTEFVRESVQEVKQRMQASYVDKKKVDRDTYNTYFRAIQDSLIDQYVTTGGTDLTNYLALTIYIPDLSRQTYGRVHRAIVEYLSRLTREALVHRLRKELGISEVYR